jgi:hypothetical protein
VVLLLADVMEVIRKFHYSCVNGQSITKGNR